MYSTSQKWKDTIYKNVQSVLNIYIDDWTDNDDNTLTIKCIDNINRFEFNYDGSELKYPATLLAVLQDICKKAGVELRFYFFS